MLTYVSRLNALAELYENKHVKFFYVFSDPRETESEIIGFVNYRHISFPVLYDKDQVLARLFDATAMTQTILIDAKGAFRYRGRIDDSPFEPDLVKDYTLKVCIDALLRHQPLPTTSTRVFSCPLPRLQSR